MFSIHAVACGENHLLLLDVDGCVFSCGSDEGGALGAGHTVASLLRPKPTARITYFLKCGVTISAVYASGASSAAVSSDSGGHNGGRTLYTWGANSDGHLGLGDHEARPTPTPVEVGGPVIDVGLGDAHMHVLYEPRSAGRDCSGDHAHSGGAVTDTRADTVPVVVCWGRSTSGRLGLGNVPMLVSGPAALRIQTYFRRYAASNRVRGVRDAR